EYNPVTNAWTQKANFPGIRRIDPVAFGIGANGYVGLGSPTGSGIPYYDFWMYTPGTNSWAIRDSFPGGPRQAANSFVIGKKGYVTLGKDYSNSKTDTWEYNPASNNWTQKVSFPIWRDRAYAFSAGSKGYVGLGYPYVTFYQFDPIADTWTPLANYPSHTRGFGVSFSINGIGYIGLGSDGSGKDSAVFWQYEPDPSILSLDASDSVICHNQTFTVPYNMGGVFDTSNNFTLQISDSTGNFANVLDIGSLHATLSGTITTTMPPTVPAGSGYRMRVVSSNPVVTGTVIEQSFSVLSSVVPSITIAPSANPSCQGSSVMFSATGQNGGNNPTYQWKLNGTTVGGNSASYSSSTLQTGDRVWSVFSSSVFCAIPPVVNSDTVTMTVLTTQPPTVQLTSSADSICSGTMVTYTATPANVYNPTYNWYYNDALVQINGLTYANANLQNNDSVWVELTSYGNCNASNIDTSNIIRMPVVSPPVVPLVSILSVSDTVCSGTSVTLNATAVNGGGTPLFQWIKNGNAVGTNSSNYTVSVGNNDSVWVILTSSALCANGVTDTSAKKIFTVQPSLSPTITISASQNNICLNTNVTFTATDNNIGSNTPIHQWKKNGISVGTNSNSYSDSSLVNGDIISCQLSGISCASPPVINSNSITMAVSAPVTPNISISTNSTSVCAGSTATFNSIVTNPGVSPGYLWLKNSVNVGFSGTTYSTSALATGDVITCILSVSQGCVTKTSDTSNSITITVNNAVVPTITVNASKTTICSGETVTFTATQTNGGSSPSYLWSKNGVSVGFSGNPYPTSNILNGDAFTARLTSNAVCASPMQVLSSPIIIAVSVPATPTISQSGNILSSNSATGNQWLLNGTPISSATGQNYTPTQSGNYRVVVTDVNGCLSQQSNTIFVSVTGIEELTTGSISVYPNPATNQLNINLGGLQEAEVRIFNVDGKLIIETRQSINNSLDISNLAIGIYLVEIKTRDVSVRRRWVKI
ncbi:MAG: T9SS type A sorting domain-containing protein, partial [Bacteroidota bacterium]